MPLSSTCRNCGLSKTPDFYSENYCSDCTSLVKEARDLAEKENSDIGAATRHALATRAHDTHNNRVDPRRPVTKSSYWNVDPRSNDA